MREAVHQTVSSSVQELFDGDTCLSEDCSERSLRHIARMVGDSRVFIRCWIKPYLMRSGGLAVKLKPQFLQFLDDLPVLETGQPAHQVPRISG